MMKIVPTASDLRLPVGEGLSVLRVPALHVLHARLPPPDPAGQLAEVCGQLETRQPGASFQKWPRLLALNGI
mgnify:CR=1 FL=1